MSRSRHIGLEREETAIHGTGARSDARRRVALEEELAAALADGDRERVLQLREKLEGDDA